MNSEQREAAKRRAGEAAVDAVSDGAIVGLGSGTTAATAIRALGQRVDAGLDITGIPTSYQSRHVAREAGVPVRTMGDYQAIDIAIDGADQVVGDILIKGGGGALTGEKVVDAAADRLLIVVDESKVTDTVTEPIPLAVVPESHRTVAAAVRELGGEPTLRSAERKAGPVVTDEGSLLLDCDFGRITNARRLASSFAEIPGIVEHGLFVDLADTVYVGTENGVRTREG